MLLTDEQLARAKELAEQLTCTIKTGDPIGIFVPSDVENLFKALVEEVQRRRAREGEQAWIEGPPKESGLYEMEFHTSPGQFFGWCEVKCERVYMIGVRLTGEVKYSCNSDVKMLIVLKHRPLTKEPA